MQKKRKEKRRDSRVWKRFLDTIIQQLPLYIAQYPPSDQLLLNEFFTLLKEYNVDIVTNREKLSTRLENFSQIYRKDKRYLQFPFLWFIVDFFANANRLLSVTDFYADDFYEYLVSFLRGDSQTLGVFNLLRDTVPLTDPKWEELQYACYTPRFLNADELQILVLIYSMISDTQVEVLDPKKLRKVITNQVLSYNTYRSLSKFFTTLNCIWNIYINFDSVDLTWIYFFVQLPPSTSLTEIIDFNNQINTTLTTSYVYQVQGTSNTYLGLLTVPKDLMNHLEVLFKNFQKQGKIHSYQLKKVIEVRTSASIVQYRSEKGWVPISNSKWKQIIDQMTTLQPRSHKKNVTPFFITPSLNQNWNYKLYDSPCQVIDLFCKAFGGYYFENLPYASKNTNHFPHFSKPEANLLRKLYRAKVASISFFPSNLISEFSLSRYWIEIPKIPFFQLIRLLTYLPFSQVYFTENGIYLWTILTLKLVNRIRKGLKWKVIPITDAHFRHPFSNEWFNCTRLGWKNPAIL
jgi:hypothetical protein